jgi:superfamily II DNA or RNA helicase
VEKNFQNQAPGAMCEPVARQQIAKDPVLPAPLSPNTVNFHKFDKDKLYTWVYPINYPTRSYQLTMIEKGLSENTLITLPTGLGKTFIAAVIMYNF